ncbi:MAG TPA: PCRF domain-containing protein, partial [Acidimicrobiales bacterium]
MPARGVPELVRVGQHGGVGELGLDGVVLALEVLSTDLSDLGGINQVTFLVKGESAWTHLKFEGGPHRV